MNRSIWTWIQLSFSLCNATFVVLSHVPVLASSSEIASMLIGQAGYRVLANATHEIKPLYRHGAARCDGYRD